MRIITGTARGARLKTIDDDKLRPTGEKVKEGMFSAVQFLLPGAEILDVFAGSGQLGIEALSRGASRAVFVDASRDALALIRENLKAAKLTQSASVISRDAFSYLRNSPERFDIVFADPPYRTYEPTELLAALENVVRPGGILLLETENEAELLQSSGRLELEKSYKYGTVRVSKYRRDEEE